MNFSISTLQINYTIDSNFWTDYNLSQKDIYKRRVLQKRIFNLSYFYYLESFLNLQKDIL